MCGLHKCMIILGLYTCHSIQNDVTASWVKTLHSSAADLESTNNNVT